MIDYKVGNILNDEADILVNTVNTVGVMGKGIAAAFKKSFPANFKAYAEEVKEGRFQVGRVMFFPTGMLHPKYVVNFPTKKDWKHPSKMAYVEEGLKDLVAKLKNIDDARSIAIPPLGCGNGRLDWNDVKPVMLRYLQDLPSDWKVTIYEPGFKDQKQVVKKELPLTNARAMFISLLSNYRILGNDINLLVAHKMAYLLQRMGEPLRLNFEKGPYGPYAHNLTFLLQKLNGAYLWYKEEENKPTTSIRLEESKLEEVEAYLEAHISTEQADRLQRVSAMIEGLESPYGLELLGTVDYIMQGSDLRDLEGIIAGIHHWTDRKREIMKPHHIKVAYERVSAFLH